MLHALFLAGALTMAAAVPEQTTPAAPVPPVAPASAQPGVTTAGQVAQIVDSEFGSYDTNKDGDLDKAEFAAWMVRLKTASDPATQADSAETQTWLNGAFAQADTDRSKSVNKTELTGFLSQGAS